MAEYIVSDKALSDATIEHFDCHVPLRLRRFKQSLGLVRIVRCRDCRHYESIDYRDGTKCDWYCGMFSVNGESWWETYEPSPDGFCSLGEVRHNDCES